MNADLEQNWETERLHRKIAALQKQVEELRRALEEIVEMHPVDSGMRAGGVARIALNSVSAA